MVKKAIIRANIPFVLDDAAAAQGALAQNAEEQGWTKFEMHGNFLLKHINTSFSKNIDCFAKQTDNIALLIPDPQDNSKRYPVTVSQVQVYYFDTGIGICTLHIPFDSDTEEDAIVNICSVLHCSAQHANSKQGKSIVQNGKGTYLSCIAEDYLRTLFGNSYMLFGTQNETDQRRINMYSAVLCDRYPEADAAAEYNKRCYQLANAYDTRDAKLTVKEEKFFHQHEYIRWCFSKRGCAAVANLSGTNNNDSFLKERWFSSIQSNYFCLYLMVLHQKLASYYYLNDIANDADMDHWKINQKTLAEFNAKYFFSIVSDEPFIQRVYLMMKQAANADEVYAELQEQLKRMFDYAQIQSGEANEATNRKLNLISVVVAVVCSISVIFDSIDFFTSCGCLFGFHTLKDGVFTGVILLEILLFLVVLTLVILANKKTK